MFNRRKNPGKSFQIDTLIGVNSRISGDVAFAGGLHLDGVVDGNIISEPGAESHLSISDSGKVNGSINVATVVLHGLVQGDIVARTRVDLGSTAKVNGNVYYGLIEMAMGAEINGKLIHQSAAVADIKVTEPDSAAPAMVVDISTTTKSKLG